jgi:hypothetical protein
MRKGVSAITSTFHAMPSSTATAVSLQNKVTIPDGRFNVGQKEVAASSETVIKSKAAGASRRGAKID